MHMQSDHHGSPGIDLIHKSFVWSLLLLLLLLVVVVVVVSLAEL